MVELFSYPMIGLNNMLWIHYSDFIGVGDNRPWVFCINLTPLDNFAIFDFVNNSFSLQSLTNDLFLNHGGQSRICHWKAYLSNHFEKVLNPARAKALFFLFVLELLTSPPKHRAWNVASYPCPLTTPSNKINHKQSVQKENGNRGLNSKCMW